MRHVRLTSIESPVTGELGLIIKGTTGEETLTDLDGSLIAHDLLEHQNGVEKIGCPGDELEAIGAIWQVRARHGTLLHKNDRHWRSLYETIAGDLYTVALDTHGGGWRPRLGQYRTNRHLHDEDFQECIDKARPDIVTALDEEGGHPFPEVFLENALHLMRTGFRKAERRFGDGMRGADLYVAVRDAVGLIIPHVQVEGQEFVLSYGGGRAYCDEFHGAFAAH